MDRSTLRRFAVLYGELASLNSLDALQADFLLDRHVHRQASKRAREEGIDLATIARALLFRAALAAEPDPDFDPAARRPPFRPAAERQRLKFWIPREPYELACAAILASRQSVAAALEKELSTYAERGLDTTPLGK